MKFTKVVWGAAASLGMLATYLLSFVSTPMLFPVVGVQEQGVPAPVLSAPVYPGATLELVPAGVIVDVLFWFVVAATILSVVADLKR